MARIVGGAVGLVIAVVLFFCFIAFCAWAFSFKGVDQGHVAVVKEGGPFDGRGVKEVRQPGSKSKPIGAFNKQYNFPVTQRDLTDEAGQIIVPTADGVNVIVDGQALFQFKTDPALVTKFYKEFAVRKWDGEQIDSDQGWINFLKIRLVPILFQSIRQTIGTKDCTSLNNTCIYVLNADQVIGDAQKAQEQAKQAKTEQNLADAEQKITTAFQQNLKDGLGDDYFEGVRFQNLRVRFLPGTQQKIDDAQNKRAEVATARLEAQRVTAEARGRADSAVEAAKGDRLAKEQQAAGVRALASAYKTNPQQAKIDQTKAFCGAQGCNPQVIGSGALAQLSGLGR